MENTECYIKASFNNKMDENYNTHHFPEQVIVYNRSFSFYGINKGKGEDVEYGEERI